MTHYEDFLSAMQAEYLTRAGFSPDDASDAGIRLKVLAAQLAAISRGVETLEQQMFPQTATGRQLDCHAAARGLARKGASCSAGVLRFSRTTPAPAEIVIPAGTVCAAVGSDADTPRFETTETVVLPLRGTAVDAPAQASRGGRDTNAAPGTITLMLTPVQSIASVSNPGAFSGGTDEEPDEALRARLLASYSAISNGVNEAFYYDYAMSFDGVASAQVIPRANGTGTVSVHLAGSAAPVTDETLEAVRHGLAKAREIGVDVTVAKAALHPVAVSIEAAGIGDDFSLLQEALRERLIRFFRSLPVGKSLLLADLSAALHGAQGLYNFHILAPDADRNAAPGTLLTLGNVSVTQMEVVV